MYTMGSIEYLNPAGFMGGLPASIATVMDAQKKMLKTDDGWGYWVGSAIAGIGQESGSDVSNLMYFISSGKGASISDKAKLFGRLKSKAKSYGAPETAVKIGEGASWFYTNVEKPSQPKKPSSSSGSSGSRPSSAPPAVQPSGFQGFYEDYKLPIIIGGSVLGIGALFLIGKSILK